MYRNIILNSDSYKYSQYFQYPPGTKYVYSYIEPRGGGEYLEGIFIGLQPFLKEYLSKPVTMKDINEAEAIITAHGEPFNREGWEYIVNKCQGILPLEIKSLKEGTRFKPGTPLVTIVNTDPKAFWLTSFMETALLRAIWYPTTVASNSWASRKLIKKYLEKNGDPAGLNFKLHDFGARGVSSIESAGLGGLAHLATGFMGTDTVSALVAAKKYYYADMAGFSIPAMEHSTVTSWGREHEEDAYRNMVKKAAKPNGLLACVSDSYDIFKACEMWGTKLKQDVIDSGATVVIRPDSGDPATVVLKCAIILDKHFGSTINEKGYKVLNNVRIIQGDGINTTSIQSILFALDMHGFSADNVAFGQGGALLQQVNRDTMKFAMKCSAIAVGDSDPVWRDVFKNPITDPGKVSKAGRFSVINTPEGLKTIPLDESVEDLLILRWKNGYRFNDQTLDQIRAIANS